MIRFSALILILVVALAVTSCNGTGPGSAKLTFDFESGFYPWQLDAGIWKLGPAGGSQALVGTGHGFARLPVGSISRLDFRFQLRQAKSGLQVSLFEILGPPHTRYFFSLRPSGVSLFRQQGSKFDLLGQEPMQFSFGDMIEATILVGGGSIDLFINKKPIVGADLATQPVKGAVSFESLDAPVAVDDVEITLGEETTPHTKAPRAAEGYPVGASIKNYFVNGVHTGNLVLNNSEVLTLKSGRYTVISGNVKLYGNARLRIEKGAALIFDRGSSPLFHWGVELYGQSRLELAGGTMAGYLGTLLRIMAFNSSTIDIQNAKPRIHLINTGDKASVKVSGSRLLTMIGGLIQLSEQAAVEVTNSTLGAIGLSVPAGSRFKGHGLGTGSIGDFDLQRDFTPTGIGYGLKLQGVQMVEDNLGEGPYERGWVLFTDENAALDITKSTLRKVVIEFPTSGPPIQVSGLRLAQPTDLAIGKVRLRGITVTGQWGFFLHADRVGKFNNSRALWFFVFDKAKVLLVNSTMNEFDPRNYTGVFAFENGTWVTGGEIIGKNDFVMEGTWQVDEATRTTLSWDDSKVTRRYPIDVHKTGSGLVGGIQVIATRGSETQTATTDSSGAASLELRFGDTNYATSWSVSAGGGPPIPVDFFTTTPLKLSAP